MYASNVGNMSIRSSDAPRIALRFILWSFGILAIWYVFILGNMVFNITERRALEARARTLSSEVGDLELAYLSMSKNIDLAFSYSLGFKEIKAKFAVRKSFDSLGLRESLGNIKIVKNEI
ncbi:hypothetical protein A3A95_00745 [Candidatus Nomurabacteria bacterium RIFCSPLOWO2_01_FULL_39_18]|nr:MAG: hypothetical protein A3A95_00745 [Candidatus Nomurabacteria bacterium RIFCSPLOWO2_01_FULL_39_18]